MTSNLQELAPKPAVAPPVLWWLRLEGLTIAVLSAVLYQHVEGNWWLFAALWLAPDLTMLGYLAGPRWGAHCYNTVHAYMLPAALAIVAVTLHHAPLLLYALIWFNHIGVDRLLGYGLKYPTGFGFTHLNTARKQGPN